jgi:hypothetical protein
MKAAGCAGKNTIFEKLRIHRGPILTDGNQNAQLSVTKKAGIKIGSRGRAGRAKRDKRETKTQ